MHAKIADVALRYSWAKINHVHAPHIIWCHSTYKHPNQAPTSPASFRHPGWIPLTLNRQTWITQQHSQVDDLSPTNHTTLPVITSGNRVIGDRWAKEGMDRSIIHGIIPLAVARYHFDGLAQHCSNYIANALELLQSFTQPSISSLRMIRIAALWQTANPIYHTC